MLRGFRHTLFLLLQIGVLAGGALAIMVQPGAWPAVLICVISTLIMSFICERIARNYLTNTLGRLRRVAEDLGAGRAPRQIRAKPGDEFYKLMQAINRVALRLSSATEKERRLQTELQQREKLALLGELAASVAHEVNNPLDGVQNCARILRRSLDDRIRANQMLDLIDSGAVRIELIVRRLLTLARENVIRPVDARLGEVLDAACRDVAEKFATRRVTIVRDNQTQDDHASVDPLLLQQVFVNLMTNAADSMSAGGELRLTLRRESSAAPRRAGSTPPPEMIEVHVADTGSGIPSEILPHIFEPFFSTKRDGRGTGLGLAIAARIIDAHQGMIEVRPREGGGTVFTVRLPARPRIGFDAIPTAAAGASHAG